LRRTFFAVTQNFRRAPAVATSFSVKPSNRRPAGWYVQCTIEPESVVRFFRWLACFRGGSRRLLAFINHAAAKTWHTQIAGVAFYYVCERRHPADISLISADDACPFSCGGY
jgi:hypothetical protein